MIKGIILLLLLCAPVFVIAQNTTEAKPEKVGYANMDYIISQLPDMKEIESELKSTQTQLRNQIQAKSQEVQKQYTDFNANAKTMADTVRTRRQSELEKAMTDLEKMQQDAQLTLQNKQKLYMAPIYLKVNRAIAEVAKENGYSIILTDKVGTFDFLLYQSNQLDVSNLVLQKFGVTPAKQ
jgi:outer membrane protein